MPAITGNQPAVFLGAALTLYLILFIVQVHLFHPDFSASPGPTSTLALDPARSSLSLQLLLEQVQKLPRPIPDDAIDPAIEQARCRRFGHPFQYNPKRTKRRRIFAGGLLADDSWHALGANALETFGIYHSVTFVESNRTQSGRPRSTRFTPESNDLQLLQSGIYGPNTQVYVKNFVHERDAEEKVPRMIREHMMRQEVLNQWKALGMGREDVGLIFDVDEIPSREFLRATQICDLVGGSWDGSANQTCRSPMLRFAVPMFEGSPMCLHSNGGGGGDPFKRFNSPSMVIGACIEGIGDLAKHGTAPRIFRSKNGQQYGGREKGYGERFDYSKIPNGRNGYFPLFNAADFRKMQAGPHKYGGVGFHLHNFFVSTEKLRFKHLTYGHKHNHAFAVPLGAMNADLNLLVKCAHNISDQGNRKERIDNGLDLLAQTFDIPATFKIEGYVNARHQEMIQILLKDEEEYGRADKFDGHHLYNETSMLTHPGRQHKVNKEKR